MPTFAHPNRAISEMASRCNRLLDVKLGSFVHLFADSLRVLKGFLDRLANAFREVVEFLLLDRRHS